MSSKDRVKCPECGSLSEILWVSPRSPHRQLQTPIVMWRYTDGSLGVAGGADSRTPLNAERVEIRSISEYRRHAREINAQIKEKEEKREERFQQIKSQIDARNRSSLSHAMGQETDPVARDIYREALKRGDAGSSSLSFREFFSTVMEMDKSNYE